MLVEGPERERFRIQAIGLLITIYFGWGDGHGIVPDKTAMKHEPRDVNGILIW